MRTFSDKEATSDNMENEKLVQAIGILISQATTNTDLSTRKYALYILSTFDNPRFTDIFIRSLYNPEKAVRSQAAMALIRIGSPALLKVVALLQDKDWKVRYRAAEVLGSIKSREAVCPLIQTLSDEKDHVRYMAAKSLGRIGDPFALEPLKNAQDDENPYVRNMVTASISSLQVADSSD